MKTALALALAFLALGAVAAAPAGDPEVPERYIHVAEARPLLGGRAVFVDVRPLVQYRDLHIQGAINVPLSDMSARLAQVPRDVPVVLY